ncbi:PLP-dependent transferase [Tenacibaculum soleae]|uniref:PLP-dependent transferase n=1 Tax=Tenacibaculum soleae TaxID=447689 RepID=UPI003AB1E625
MLFTHGTVTFKVRGGDEKTHALIENLNITKQATCLGCAESLISLPCNTSQTYLPRTQIKLTEMNDDLKIFSVGVKDRDIVVALLLLLFNIINKKTVQS